MTDEFADPLNRIQETAQDIRGMLHQTRSIGNATINVQAGGVALWAAVTCCIVQLIVLMIVIGGGLYVVAKQDDTIRDLNVKITRAQDYLNVLYQKDTSTQAKASP